MERMTGMHRLAILMGITVALTMAGCLAQQADVTRIKRDLDKQIAQLREGKQALESSLERANDVIAHQKAEVQELQTARADLLDEMQRLRQADLSEVRGTLEQTTHQISGLRGGLEELNHRLVALHKKVDQERQSVQAALKEAQNKLTQQDQALATHDNKSREYKASLETFKQALQTLGDELAQEDKRLAAMDGRLEALARDQGTDSRQTETYLRNVQGNIRSVVDTLETVTTKLSTRLDEQGHRLARLEQEMPLPVRTNRAADSHSSPPDQDRTVGNLRASLAPIEFQHEPREERTIQNRQSGRSTQEVPQRHGPQSPSEEPGRIESGRDKGWQRAGQGDAATNGQLSGPVSLEPGRTHGWQQTGYVGAAVNEQRETAESVYGGLLKRVSEGRYETAIHGFSDFLMRFPDSDLAPNAQYWLGECYYGQREFSQAVKEFERVLHIYPGSDKVPAALLKIGFAQLELQRWKMAEETLDQLVRAYPESREAQKAQMKLAQLR